MLRQRNRNRLRLQSFGFPRTHRTPPPLPLGLLRRPRGTPSAFRKAASSDFFPSSPVIISRFPPFWLLLQLASPSTADPLPTTSGSDGPVDEASGFRSIRGRVLESATSLGLCSLQRSRRRAFAIDAAGISLPHDYSQQLYGKYKDYFQGYINATVYLHVVSSDEPSICLCP